MMFLILALTDGASSSMVISKNFGLLLILRMLKCQFVKSVIGPGPDKFITAR